MTGGASGLRLAVTEALVDAGARVLASPGVFERTVSLSLTGVFLMLSHMAPR